MNIKKIGNKFKKHGIRVYSTKYYTKIVIYNNLKHPTAPIFTTLLLTEYELVMKCVGNQETPGYRQVLTNQRDIVALLNFYYYHVKTKVKLKDIPREIQENVIAYGKAKAVYFDDECASTFLVTEVDGYVLVDGKYIKSSNIEILKDLKLRVVA